MTNYTEERKKVVAWKRAKLPIVLAMGPKVSCDFYSVREYAKVLTYLGETIPTSGDVTSLIGLSVTLEILVEELEKRYS